MCVCARTCYCFWVFAGVGLTSGSTRSAPDISAPLLSSFPLLRSSAAALPIHSEQWNFYIGQTAFFYNLTQRGEEPDRIAQTTVQPCIKCLIKETCCNPQGCCRGFKSIQIAGWLACVFAPGRNTPGRRITRFVCVRVESENVPFAKCTLVFKENVKAGFPVSF